MKNVLKKLICISGLLFIFNICANAQILNLLPDPSIEDTTNNVNGDIYASLKQWKSLDSTRPYNAHATYFNYNSTNIGYSLPDNQWCYQEARGGGGVMAFDFIWVFHPTTTRSIC